MNSTHLTTILDLLAARRRARLNYEKACTEEEAIYLRLLTWPEPYTSLESDLVALEAANVDVSIAEEQVKLTQQSYHEATAGTL